MSLIVVDVEADGPCPGLYSMVSFGAVIVDPKLDKTFYGQTKPITLDWIPEALAVSKISREEHEKYPSPLETMAKFRNWLSANIEKKDRPVFISDNPAFDWQFINYYFIRYIGTNPFGFSARRIADIFAGYERNMRVNWKQYRKTKHTHHPVDDAKGNAEALLYLANKGVKFIV